MRLHLCHWPAVEAYLTRSTGILIPIGSTEQHGPYGAIGTDAICAETLAWGVGDAVDALVAPTIAVGMALHHLAFPGTISLQPSTLSLVVRDYVVSLARHGFTHFFFINGHGGNIATLKAAFAETYATLAEMPSIAQRDRVQCRLHNWFMGRATMALARELYGDREGSHATPSELSLTQYAYPETAWPIPTPLPAAPRGYPITSATQFRRDYPDGRMGSDPTLARPEDGQRFYDTAVQEIADSYRAFLAVEP